MRRLDLLRACALAAGLAAVLAPAGSGALAIQPPDFEQQLVAGPVTEEKVVAADGAGADRFGGLVGGDLPGEAGNHGAIAIDGDVAVVGAPGDDGKMGAAYVFERSDTTWVQAARLTASDRAPDPPSPGNSPNTFGRSVAIDGDTIAVGAPGADTGVPGDDQDNGAVYLFPRTGAPARTETAKLTPSVSESEDLPHEGEIALGKSVEIDGDTIVAGALWGGGGRVYTFARTGAAARNETAALTATDLVAGDRLGEHVGIDGDTIVASAPSGDVDGKTEAGSLYTFDRTGPSLRTETAKLTASDGQPGDRLGVSVAIEGDTIVAGMTSGAGAVYTFARTGAAQRPETAKLTASDGAEFDGLGTSVAIDGDTIVAGAPSFADAGAGAAYTFARTGDAVRTETGKLTSADGAEGDRLGQSVAIDGATIGAGAPGDEVGPNEEQGSASFFRPTAEGRLSAAEGTPDDELGRAVAVAGDLAVVGAPRDTGNRGAAYVFELTWNGWVEVAKLTASDTGPNVLGSSVAIDADTIVAGAPNHDGGSGAVYLFAREGPAVRTETQRLTAADAAPNDRLGASVDVDGDTIVAGAFDDDVGANGDQGSAYTFTRGSGGGSWAQSGKLTASDGAGVDELGHAVAIDGDMIVAGAPQDDLGPGGNQGSVYTFTRTGAAERTETAKLTASDAAASDQLGAAVALDGDTVVAGAHFDDVGTDVNQGSVYTFARTGPAARTQTAKLTVSDGVAGDELGSAVAIAGDTIVAGAPHELGEAGDQGSVYTFTRTGPSARTQTARLTAPDAEAGDQHGISVATDSEAVFAGAFMDDFDGDTNRGSTWVSYGAPAQCADTQENDSDGLVDHPADPGCSSAADDSESPDPPPPGPKRCSDGLDNDSDGTIDHPADEGCASAEDDTERGGDGVPATECADGQDNDADGKVDHPADPGCESAEDDSESPDPAPPPKQCADGQDNDGDGKVDHPADPGCGSAGDDDETDPTPPPDPGGISPNPDVDTGGGGGGLPQFAGPVIRLPVSLTANGQGSVPLKVGCLAQLSPTCVVLVKGSSASKVAASAKKRLNLGQRRYSIPQGTTKTVKFKLSRKAFRYLKRKGSLRARFTVTSGTLRSSDITRLRAPRR